MSTIIDELIVTLGLDPAQYKKGSRETEESLKKTREASRTSTRDIESQNKRAGESFSKLKNEAVGLFLTFAGASSIASFVGNILSGDAATGRLAKNLGLATNELSAWEQAVKTVGGTAADADGALNKLSNLYYQFRTGQLDGTSGQLLASLGVFNPEDLATPTKGLLKLAEAADKFAAEGKTQEFRQRMLQLGIPEATINLLEQGRVGVEKLIAEKKRDSAASQQNADDAAKFQKALADLEARVTNSARPALYGMVQTLIELDAKFGLVNVIMPVASGLLVAVGVAAAGAIGPVGLLAGALVVLYNQLTHFPAEALRGWGIIGDMVKKGDISGAAKLLYNSIGDWAGNGFGMGGGDAPAGGPAPSSGNSGGGGSNADFFRANGFTDAQARGIAAGIHAESGGDPNAYNKSSGAMGIGQWLGPRKKKLIARYGPNPTLAQQRQFMLDELRGGDHGGAAVRGATTDVGTLDAYIDKFMRPAQGAETIGDKRRGRAFLGYRGAAAPAGRSGAPSASGGGGDTHTTIGTIVVNTAATDANGIAKDLRGAIARRTVTTGANQGLE